MEKATPVPFFTSIYTLLLARLAFIVLFLYLLKAKVFFPAFFLFILILVIETAGLWSRAGFFKLEVITDFNPCRLFPGEETIFTVTVANKKRLPVLLNWIQSLSPLPQIFSLEGESVEDINGQAYLGSYAKTAADYRVTAQKRGYYKMPALRLYSRDVLGLFYRETLRGETRSVIVYPRLIDLEDIYLRPSDFSGLERDNRPFLFDPIMFVGLREYTPDMPARFIHWKASAHQDRLMAKIIEPSASLQILIAIDAETFLLPEPQEDLFEKALSVAATLAVWADSNKVPFGLIANAARKEQPGAVIIPVNRDLKQGKLVLESLARAELAVLGNLEDILKTEALYLPWGTTLIVIGKNYPSLLPPAIRQAICYPIENNKEAENELP